MKTITNTTREVRLHGIPPVMAILGPAPIIRAQESQGQRELLAASVLPTQMHGGRAGFERLGFVFGEEVDGDPLFIHATLPAGWTKEGSEHAMHSIIRDAQGRERVGVFYKAAFYDRKADMSLVKRYRAEAVYEQKTWRVHATVTDRGTVIWTGKIETAANARAMYETGDRLEAEAIAWLDEHRPKHADPVASWDDDAVPAPVAEQEKKPAP